MATVTTHELPPRRRDERYPTWEVRYDGKPIGYVKAKRIGYGSRGSLFYEGIVTIDGRDISVENDTNFQSRVDAVVGAWLDPASNVHTKYRLRL